MRVGAPSINLHATKIKDNSLLYQQPIIHRQPQYKTDGNGLKNCKLPQYWKTLYYLWHGLGWKRSAQIGVQRFLGHSGIEHSSMTGVWCNKTHKCSVKSSFDPAFSHKNGVLHSSCSEKTLSFNSPLYACKSYSKAPSLRLPLKQTSRGRTQTWVLPKYLKRGKFFPWSSPAADLSWSMKSMLAPLLKPFLQV